MKTDFLKENQDQSQNPVIAKFQKWPRMLRTDYPMGPRGLESLANFLTPIGASRQVCIYQPVALLYFWLRFRHSLLFQPHFLRKN